MWIPASIYERLPLIYLITGLLTLALLGLNGISGVSATMLVLAAARIYTWRREFRQKASYRSFDDDATRPASL